jgi:hypothetical protein
MQCSSVKHSTAQQQSGVWPQRRVCQWLMPTATRCVGTVFALSDDALGLLLLLPLVLLLVLLLLLLMLLLLL